MMTGHWVQCQSADVEVGIIAIDPLAVRKSIIQSRLLRNQTRKILADKRSINITYEELCESYNKTTDRIFNFIGVEPIAVKPDTTKQLNKPLSKVISNYDEIIDAVLDLLPKVATGSDD